VASILLSSSSVWMKRAFFGKECRVVLSSLVKRHASGFKAAKDRLTLLLGGKAKGDFKLKPMFVCQSQTL
jgi:hypothetical protein